MTEKEAPRANQLTEDEISR
ncbi:jg27866, partial [Pararge aegeria aegeria]